MRILNFDQEHAQAIQLHDSQKAFIFRIASEIMNGNIIAVYLDPGGVLGYHKAAEEQLFIVVHGNGWVSGKVRHPINIQVGQAVYWYKGEWHESGSEKGKTAYIIEAPDLHPAFGAA